jgi:hypothetical protein
MGKGEVAGKGDIPVAARLAPMGFVLAELSMLKLPVANGAADGADELPTGRSALSLTTSMMG